MIKNYLIIKNKNNFKTLVYYPVAKNANSSVKLFLIKHLGIEKKFFFLDNEIPCFLQTKKMLEEYDTKINLVNFIPSYSKFEKVDADNKCCLVRDPIKRFVSAYNNRILFHQDEGFKNHSIDQIIEKLENNNFENKHFLPQNYWLGNDLKFFNIVSNTNDMSEFIDSINKFFEKKISFPKMQTGKGKNNISLNLSQKQKIKKIYEHDYELIGNLL